LVSTQLDISALIRNPSKIGEEEILMLREELKNSPWCATFQVLIAKGYANVNSYQQNKHLRLASTYIGDRVMLFNLMNDLQEGASLMGEPIVTEVLDTEEAEPIVTEVLDTEEAEPIVTEVLDTEEAEPIVTEVLDTEEAEPIVTEVLCAEETEPVTAEIKTVVENEEKLVAEEIVVPEEIEAIATVSDIMQEPNAVVLEKPVDEGIAPQENIKNKEARPQEPAKVEMSEVPSVAEKIDFDKIVKYDPLKELEALKVRVAPQKKPLSFDTVIYNTEKELSKLIEQKEEAEKKGEQDFTAWLNNVGDDKKDTALLSKSADKVQLLLDQFLATKRKRPIQNRTFYSAQNKAEESEVDSMDVLSETLLELYVKQGYHSKAIAGYEKLSLQNPKKSAYFVDRIIELKQL
jgi:hypothetical protein